MKDNNEERMIISLLMHDLEKNIPEGIDLWPTIHARSKERRFAAGLQHLPGFDRFSFRHIRAASAVAGVLVGVIGLYLWIIQPKLVDAHEILNKAQNAQVLSTNSGICTFTLTQKIDERSSSGEFHAEIKRWFQEPGQCRIESRWSGWMPEDKGTMTFICDGTTEWIQEGNSITISKATPQPETDDITPWSRQKPGLTNVLNQVTDRYSSPKLKGEETVAGRTTYVIDLGLPNSFSNSAPELNNGRRVVWVDKETFFLLKTVQYSPTDDSVVGVMEVTHIQYNIPIDPVVFSFTPPQGAHVQDLRSGNYPPKTNPPKLTSLAEARETVSFSIFIPTSVPEGLVPEPPTLDEGPPAHIYVNYQAGDGSIGLSVINSPAGSGLDADPRKTGETIKIRGNIVGHFLDNEPQFGGPILWWQEAGSYVALSGSELHKTDLVKIANSMSSTADLK